MGDKTMRRILCRTLAVAILAAVIGLAQAYSPLASVQSSLSAIQQQAGVQ